MSAKHTKKQTRAEISPLWTRISTTETNSIEMKYLGGRVLVERVYHRGRVGPIWSPSYSWRDASGMCRLQSDSLSTFVDQIHRFILGGECSWPRAAITQATGDA